MGPLDGQLTVSPWNQLARKKCPAPQGFCTVFLVPNLRSDWFCFVVPESSEVERLADRRREGRVRGLHSFKDRTGLHPLASCPDAFHGSD